MRKRTTRTIIFLFTLLIFFGGIGAAGWFYFKGRSAPSGPGEFSLSAPTNVNDFFLSLYLDSRRNELTLPAGDDPATVVFTVEPGESVGHIASRLQSEGLVRDGELFRL